MVLKVSDKVSVNKALCKADSHPAFQTDMFAHLWKKRGTDALEKPQV